MSTRLKVVTALGIVAVTITGVLACSVYHRFTPAFIVLPDEPARMLLVPMSSAVERPGDFACCKTGGPPPRSGRRQRRGADRFSAG